MAEFKIIIKKKKINSYLNFKKIKNQVWEFLLFKFDIIRQDVGVSNKNHRLLCVVMSDFF